MLGGVWRYRVGSPRRWSLRPEEVDVLIGRAKRLKVSPVRRKPFVSAPRDSGPGPSAAKRGSAASIAFEGPSKPRYDAATSAPIG